MEARDILMAALRERFATRGLRAGAGPGPAAVFPAAHAEVGDVTVRGIETVASSIGTIVAVRVTIGEIVADEFVNFDAHLDGDERARRVTKDVVRFLEELFADRLVFWQSQDADDGKRGWRERGNATEAEPLVLDDRTYRVYLWSGPVGEWRAVPAILGRGCIRTGREYEILRAQLDVEGAIQPPDRDLARQLIADYEGLER